METPNVEKRRVFVLPGMGADARMYPGVWRELDRAKFLGWPHYAGERSIREIAERVDLVLEGGHLIAMTHAEECVRFLVERGIVAREA